MKKKSFLAMLLALCLCFALTACSSSSSGSSDSNDSSSANSDSSAETSDLEYVKEKGTLVVGITEFEPMDYQDANGNWIGFDADMAAAFADSLGVKVEFQVIDWDNKVFELDGKNIDVVWNGMTLTDAVQTAMTCSNAYCNNAQVVVTK
jgi:polar amino acid transport system substrate-binding protein